jgi:DNA-binding response OmpR family regulator
MDRRVSPPVLLVEGDDAEAELLVRVLGAAADVARDADDALQRLDSGAYRVILVSDRLPGPDGLDLVRRIRTRGSHGAVPVVLLTSTPDPALVTRAYRYGVNSVIRKPMAFEPLRAAMREVAAYWLRRNEPAETTVGALP